MNARILERPPESEMTFDQRLFWLNEDIERSHMGMMDLGGSGGVFLGINPDLGGPRMVQQHITQLQNNIAQAQEYLALAENGEGGSGDVTCEVTPEDVAERLAKGLPVGSLPKKDTDRVFHIILKAMSALAEYLEEADRHAEALPFYHEIVTFTHQKNKAGTIWVTDETFITVMANLGLCYKRLKLYNRAQDWYNRCFQLVKPGCEDENLQNNQHMLNVAKREDAGRPPVVLPVCWSCGNNARASPNIRLFACAKCNAERKEDVARYCNRTCQERDWKHHKESCHST